MSGRKEQLIERNRKNIIDSADILFQKKGISETTVDDIAKEAGCSKSTLYVYFKSKEEIVNTILCECMEHLRDIVIDAVNKDEDFETNYYRICECVLDFQEKYSTYYDMLLGRIKVVNKLDESDNTIWDGNERALLGIYNASEEINIGISSWVKECIKKGYIREDLNVLPAVMLFWAEISEIAELASHKEEYIIKRFNMSKKEYMHYAFELLLESIIKRD